MIRRVDFLIQACRALSIQAVAVSSDFEKPSTPRHYALAVWGAFA